ncbi:hypothetical protein [Kineococcus esterisolvens]|uniref:hypothetical protein n=1 Tax=unclassified Kineococcus TaxID=2621656 RepID=UPI003D7F0485
MQVLEPYLAPDQLSLASKLQLSAVGWVRRAMTTAMPLATGDCTVIPPIAHLLEPRGRNTCMTCGPHRTTPIMIG